MGGGGRLVTCPISGFESSEPQEVLPCSPPVVVGNYLAILYTIPEFIPDGRRGRQGGLKSG